MRIRTRVNRDGLVFLGILAVVLLGAIVRQVNLLLLFGAILACFGLFDYRSGRRSLRGLTVRRKEVTSQVVGAPLRVPIRLTSTRRRGNAYAIVAEDSVIPPVTKKAPREQSGESLPSDARGSINTGTKDDTKNGTNNSTNNSTNDGTTGRVYRPICYFDAIRPSQSITEQWTGIFPRRGRYRLGPITISTRYPLGFFRSSVTIPAESFFYIEPKRGNIARTWLSALRQRLAENAPRRSRIDRTGEELFGIRQWQPMDERKWIHQRSSAKYQKLLVRQFQNRTLQTVAVILDLYDQRYDPRYNPRNPLPAETLRERENQELAVCFTATLIDELVKNQKTPVTFGLVGQLEDKNSCYFCRNASASLSEVARHLATAEPTGTDTLPELLRQCAGGTAVSQIILVTTGPLDGESRSGWLADGLFRQILSRAFVVDSGSPLFDTLFWFDPPRGEAPDSSSCQELPPKSGASQS